MRVDPTSKTLVIMLSGPDTRIEESGGCWLCVRKHRSVVLICSEVAVSVGSYLVYVGVENTRWHKAMKGKHDCTHQIPPHTKEYHFQVVKIRRVRYL